jgi:2-amino-4-hydroxy-6-hydroxymethyldihydropteridine diphosphokinase
VTVTRAVLSVGSNLGDRAAHLRSAVYAFADVLVSASRVYETPPWGDPDQPAYLNAALLVSDPNAEPGTWLDRARAAEDAAGRRRDTARRFGPRTLDVDVIGVWRDDGEPVLSDDPQLTLPHPRAHLRAFVLRPWLDIEPDAALPGRGRLADLLRAEPAVTDLRQLSVRADQPLESGE